MPTPKIAASSSNTPRRGTTSSPNARWRASRERLIETIPSTAPGTITQPDAIASSAAFAANQYKVPPRMSPKLASPAYVPRLR